MKGLMDRVGIQYVKEDMGKGCVHESMSVMASVSKTHMARQLVFLGDFSRSSYC